MRWPATRAGTAGTGEHRREGTGRLWRAVEAVAAAVAAARRARALHPRGRTFHATVRTVASLPEAVPLAPGTRYAALVRLSRGAGLPAGWPDVLGVAVRIHDAGGPGVPLDLLASTTVGHAPVARHIPMPRRRQATTYTTVAGYRTGRGRRYFAVLPDPADGGATRFLLAVASVSGRWRLVGQVRVGEPVAADLDGQIGFDPVRHGVPGLATEGLLWRLRAAAYRGSRRGRDGHLTP